MAPAANSTSSKQQSKAPTLPQTATIACGVSTRVPLTAFPPSSTVQQVLPRVKRGEGVHYVKVQTIYLYIISPGHLGWCLLVISQVIHPLPPRGRCCSRAKLDYQADIIGHLGDDWHHLPESNFGTMSCKIGCNCTSPVCVCSWRLWHFAIRGAPQSCFPITVVFAPGCVFKLRLCLLLSPSTVVSAVQCTLSRPGNQTGECQSKRGEGRTTPQVANSAVGSSTARSVYSSTLVQTIPSTGR